MEQIKITHIYKTNIWIENDLFGGRHVMVQHETCEPFNYCTFNYNYMYTDNASSLNAATKMALSLGATEPVEQRHREIPTPTKEEIVEEIKNLEDLLKNS